jgi:hypothetical protein
MANVYSSTMSNLYSPLLGNNIGLYNEYVLACTYITTIQIVVQKIINRFG